VQAVSRAAEQDGLPAETASHLAPEDSLHLAVSAWLLLRLARADEYFHLPIRAAWYLRHRRQVASCLQLEVSFLQLAAVQETPARPVSIPEVAAYTRVSDTNYQEVFPTPAADRSVA